MIVLEPLKNMQQNEAMIKKIDSYSDRALMKFCREHHIPLPIYPNRQQLIISVTSYFQCRSLQRSRNATPIPTSKKESFNYAYHSPKFSFMKQKKNNSDTEDPQILSFNHLNCDSSFNSSMPSFHRRTPQPSISRVILDIAEKENQPKIQRDYLLHFLIFLLIICTIMFCILFRNSS